MLRHLRGKKQPHKLVQVALLWPTSTRPAIWPPLVAVTVAAALAGSSQAPLVLCYALEKGTRTHKVKRSCLFLITHTLHVRSDLAKEEGRLTGSVLPFCFTLCQFSFQDLLVPAVSLPLGSSTSPPPSASVARHGCCQSKLWYPSGLQHLAAMSPHTIPWMLTAVLPSALPFRERTTPVMMSLKRASRSRFARVEGFSRVLVALLPPWAPAPQQHPWDRSGGRREGEAEDASSPVTLT